MPNNVKLPDSDILEIQNKIVKHFQSLNASGKVPSKNISREDALRALGFAPDVEAGGEQWLCGADGNCGVKTAS